VACASASSSRSADQSAMPALAYDMSIIRPDGCASITSSGGLAGQPVVIKRPNVSRAFCSIAGLACHRHRLARSRVTSARRSVHQLLADSRNSAALRALLLRRTVHVVRPVSLSGAHQFANRFSGIWFIMSVKKFASLMCDVSIQIDVCCQGIAE